MDVNEVSDGSSGGCVGCSKMMDGDIHINFHRHMASAKYKPANPSSSPLKARVNVRINMFAVCVCLYFNRAIKRHCGNR